ncbi:MAG: hypothetical protein ACI4S1_00310 [Roseburia sp.]
MISQQEKENILLGFKNIQIGINRLLSMIDKYTEKENEITALLNTRFSINDADSLLTKFINQKSNLISLKESFYTTPTIDDTINDQYKTFLQAEITQFNPESLHLLQQHTQTEIYNFLDKQNVNQLLISPDDNNIILWIKEIPNQYTQYINTLLDLQCKLNIFDKIKNINPELFMIIHFPTVNAV